MIKPYNHTRIEQKWQKEWEKKKLYTTANKVKGKKNEMVLVEFPYPSGNLHVGHWYAFALPDIYARFRRMSGKNVLYPIGFDAFGLPAENAAIKRGINPKTWTYQNMSHMRKQIASMGTMFDWSREVVTCDPAYYKWTQALFLELYRKGLVYRKPTVANWCPSCKTVLANEQVLSGACERCGSVVHQREMPQWNIAITRYADRLVDDLETLDWPDAIKESQRNWIGRSHGMTITYPIVDTREQVSVFTTRPDTNFGATFIVAAPDSQFVKKHMHAFPCHAEVREYCDAANKKTQLERLEGGTKKTGVFTGWYAKNQLNDTQLPIYIGDFVLGNVGTGVVVGVPGHDVRDFEFAQAMHLPVVRVVVAPDGDTSPITRKEQVQEDAGTMIASGFLNGLSIHDATQAIMKYLEEKGWGKRVTTYRMRDWVVSRQRYWGVPIPMIYCKHCEAKKAGSGYNPVPEKSLPVVLPRVNNYLPNEEGKSPLSHASRWVKAPCPVCKKTAERETDTLDTFVCSSWYYLRYADPKNKKMFASKDALKEWLPISLYSGGAEHTTMHLLYSRFWHKALYDLRLVPEKEPYTHRMNRGIILGPDGQKMSKSKGNVIDPDDVVARLGTDTVRMYLAFIGPYNEVGSYPWNSDSIAGVRRFIERVWKMADSLVPTQSDATEVALHVMIEKVSNDMARLQYNTCIAQLMTFLNSAEKNGITEAQYAIFLTILAPFAPHVTEELWHILGRKTFIHLEKWPTANKKKLLARALPIAVQVNGKVRATIEVTESETASDVIQKAKMVVGKWVENMRVVKEMYVPGRIVSLVVADGEK